MKTDTSAPTATELEEFLLKETEKDEEDDREKVEENEDGLDVVILELDRTEKQISDTLSPKTKEITDLLLEIHKNEEEDENDDEDIEIIDEEGRGWVCCANCPSPISHKANLSNHVIDNSSSLDDIGERLFECGCCGSQFLEERSLNMHLLISEETWFFECRTCPRMFTSKSDLTQHTEMHEGINCDWCDLNFATRSNLRKHQRGKHPFKCIERRASKAFSCRTCTQSFPSRIELIDHYRTHVGIKVCVICDARLSTQGNLNRHIRSVHPEPYNCNLCQRPFQNLYNVKIHKRLVHKHIRNLFV